MTSYGAIEVGGTKVICGVGTGPFDVAVSEAIPTTTPAETMARVKEFFAGNAVEKVGIACFGPLEIPKGRISKFTPKIAWRGFSIGREVEKMLGVPVALDTDVNGAAMGERLWGAAKGVENFVYVTVGTGIGGGVMLNGQLVHGKLHPEVGHMRIRRFAGDEYWGHCPSHGDCLEGLACGPAIAARWGLEKAEGLDIQHPAWGLEAHYLGQMVVNLTCMYSPELVIIGGGIGLRTGMLKMVKSAAEQEMNGYVPMPKLAMPRLRHEAGVLGALALAMGSD